jgi:transposase
MGAPVRVVTMSVEELRRVYVVKQVCEREVSQKKAAELLGLSYRQTKRVVKRVKEEGEGGIIHRLRGRRGNRGMREGVKARIMRVYYEKYCGFGPTFASEKLQEREGLRVDHETLRRWLRGEGKWEWQRKGRKHRQWRQRKEQRGEMVQVDGSHHDWLEGRGPQLVLMGYVDDATGRVWARFYDYEGTMPALDSFMRYVRRYGVPQRIYLDKHTTYRSPKTQSIEEQLRGEEPMSQFERAMKELGVVVIHAHSPQAKGRIERVFGTFQDRVVKEMRLAGIESKEEANAFLGRYLGRYNRRFSVAPVKGGDLHRKAPRKGELERILCMKEERSVRNDGVIQHHNRFYRLDERLSRRVKRVIVEDRVDGSVRIRHHGTYLEYREIPAELLVKPKAKREKKIQRRPKPSKDHPWRKFRIKPYVRTHI